MCLRPDTGCGFCFAKGHGCYTGYGKEPEGINEDIIGASSVNNNEQDAEPLPKLRERYVIPETYQYYAELAEGHFILNIDAEVDVPDTNRIPIVRVERTEYDPDVVRTLFNVLCGDTEMYYLQQVYSKAQIADRIKYLSEEIADEQAYVKEYGEEGLAYVKAEIEQLKKSYSDASETVEEERCYGEMRVTKLYGTEPASMGIVAVSKEQTVLFCALNPDPKTLLRDHSYLDYSDGRSQPDHIFFFRVPDDFTVDGYTPEEAEKDVSTF